MLRAYYNLGSPYQGDEIKEDERGDFRSCIEPNCGMFLQWLASGDPRTRTLLTSRLYPKELDGLDGCLRKDLEQMDKEDAVAFFHRQDVKGTRAEIEMACESVGYHPLSLRLLSGMIVRDLKNPGDIIRAEYLLGTAYLMKRNLVEAEKHLTEALSRDRKINLVELEPDILLEFTKLRFKQNHKEEALKFVEEALQIADRCEYRLKQADIHNFLAEFYLDAGDFERARTHGEIAKERAECGYKPALEKAEKMLNDIEGR